MGTRVGYAALANAARRRRFQHPPGAPVRRRPRHVLSIASPPCDTGVIRGAPETPGCASHAKGWLLAATILGSSVAFIEASVINVALPAIQDGLGASSTEMQWIASVYTLFLAALTLAAGAAGDRFGRRRLVPDRARSARAGVVGGGAGRDPGAARGGARGAGHRGRAPGSEQPDAPERGIPEDRARPRRRHLVRRHGPHGGRRSHPRRVPGRHGVMARGVRARGPARRGHHRADGGAGSGRAHREPAAGGGLAGGGARDGGARRARVRHHHACGAADRSPAAPCCSPLAGTKRTRRHR